MPELPEVETTCRGIRDWLTGATVTQITLRTERLRWPLPSDLAKQVPMQITSVRRRGKYLLIDSNRGTLLCHLGMSGSLRIVTEDEPLRKHDHIIWQLSQGTQLFSLRYHDPRRFGCLLWTRADGGHPLLDHLGPEPLSPEFDAHALRQKLGHSQRAIKTALMDSRIVVGVGNIYASEALYLAGVRPTRRCHSLKKREWLAIAEQVKAVLDAAITQGGTTLRDFVNSQGEPGYFAQQLHVYGRAGQACKQCGEIIQSALIAQRNTFWCPRCQR